MNHCITNNQLDLRRGILTVCGSSVGGMLPGHWIDCPDCLASEEYRAYILEIELAFEGNVHSWWLAYVRNNIHDRNPQANKARV